MTSQVGLAAKLLDWLVGALEPWNFMSFHYYWECHSPNWRSHIFQRGRLNHHPVDISERSVHIDDSTTVAGAFLSAVGLTTGSLEYPHGRWLVGLPWEIALVKPPLHPCSLYRSKRRFSIGGASPSWRLGLQPRRTSSGCKGCAVCPSVSRTSVPQHVRPDMVPIAWSQICSTPPTRAHCGRHSVPWLVVWNIIGTMQLGCSILGWWD